MGNALLSTDRPDLSTGPPRWLWVVLAALWLMGTGVWLAADRGLRDGDEEGHVGAADLLRAELEAGELAHFVNQSWRGDLGDYPSLYPAAVAVVWAASGGDQPGRVPVRLLNASALLMAAGAASRLARRTAEGAAGAWAGLAAFAATLLLPLANGLARHLMPEGLLVACTAVTALAAARAVERASAGRLGALGAALGAGLLVKQTFVLGAAPIFAWALLRLRARALLSGAVAIALAGPWYAGHLLDQERYLTASALAREARSLADHLIYYPMVAAWEGLGPALLLALLLALPALRRASGTGLAWTWLLGGLLLLSAVPKKYPRLLAPITPAAAVLLGVAAARTRRPDRALLAGGSLGAAWLLLSSTHTLETPTRIADFDGSCPQRWLRAPQPDEFGLSAVASAAAAAGPGPIVVLDAPEIPCEVATTPPWDTHLAPYLERAGLDREVLSLPAGADEPDAALIVDWQAGPGQRVEVPALGRGFWLRTAHAGRGSF